MGCWSIWCFICGNPNYGGLGYYHHNDVVKHFMQNIEFFKTSKLKKNKKSKTTKSKTYYDPLEKKYIDAYENDKTITDRLNKMGKMTNWLNNLTFLTVDNKIVHNIDDISCNITFEDNAGTIYVHNAYVDTRNSEFKRQNDNNIGFVMHTDCWNFIYKEYGIKLKYGDLPVPNKIDDQDKIFGFLYYGEIEKYWSQFLDFIEIVIDFKEHILSSPLNYGDNVKIIKQNFNKLKIRKDRPSPSTSATFYKNNTYKIGGNGNIWVVKNNKWIEFAKSKTYNEIYSIDKYKKMSSNLRFIGESNDKPIFVKSVNINKKDVEIKYITN